MKSYHFIKKVRVLSKIFFVLLNLACAALSITAVQAIESTVKSGQYFWQISHPGLNPSFSYIMGSHHYMCLDNNSLPIEIKKALRSSTVGALEANTEVTKEQMRISLNNAIFYLPEGLTLSDYLGEEKVREIFDFFRLFVSTYDTEGKDLEKIFKTRFNIDVDNYDDFNRLNFQVVTDSLSVISGFETADPDEKNHASEVENKISSEVIQDFITDSYEKLAMMTDEDKILDYIEGHDDEQFSPAAAMLFAKNREVCFSNTPIGMDFFVEKALFCDKKEVYPLETAVDVLSAVLYAQQNSEGLEVLASHLYNAFDEIKNKRKQNFRFFSDFPTDLFTTLHGPFETFKNIVITGYKQMSSQKEGGFHARSSRDFSAQSDVYTQMVDFLQKRGCAVSSPSIRSLINAYMHELQQKVDFSMQVRLSGRPINEEITNTYFGFSAKLRQMEQNIFSACFPDYQYADTELEDERELEGLKILKRVSVLTTSRDAKMAQSITHLLDKGEKVFAVVGFYHLDGVIRRLKDAGYIINPLEISSPIIQAEGCVGIFGYDDPEKYDIRFERPPFPPL